MIGIVRVGRHDKQHAQEFLDAYDRANDALQVYLKVRKGAEVMDCETGRAELAAAAEAEEARNRAAFRFALSCAHSVARAEIDP